MCHTIQHRAVLIIFPLYLQTITITLMLSSRWEGEEIDAVDAVGLYERIEELLDKETKGTNYTLVMGDWNAVVGEGKEDVSTTL